MKPMLAGLLVATCVCVYDWDPLIQTLVERCDCGGGREGTTYYHGPEEGAPGLPAPNRGTSDAPRDHIPTPLDRFRSHHEEDGDE